MKEDIRNKLNYLITLKNNPMSDINAIARLKNELEWLNVAEYSQVDMQLLNQALK